MNVTHKNTVVIELAPHVAEGLQRGLLRLIEDDPYESFMERLSAVERADLDTVCALEEKLREVHR